MIEYPKIECPFIRDPDTHKLTDEWRTPEIEYLSKLEWRFTEKIHGTNVRVIYTSDKEPGTWHVEFRGRTDKADMPQNLTERLREMFPGHKLDEAFRDHGQVTLYGEGFGPKIQKGGGNYGSQANFALFDVRVGNYWLLDDVVVEIAKNLGIPSVPFEHVAKLDQAINWVKSGYQSHFGEFEAEGVVGRPIVPMFNRKGKRIMVKIKAKDFK